MASPLPGPIGHPKGLPWQGAELQDDLRSALHEALEMNRADALAAAEGSSYEKVTVSVAA